MKHTFLLFFLLFISFLNTGNHLVGENPKKDIGIQWVSFEELEQKMKDEPRKVIIDLYATWCGPCKYMEKTTFHNPIISQYINEKYYAVKFNGEEKRTIKFKGDEFHHVAGGRNGINELAPLLIHNSAFPTVIFMNEKLEVIQKFNFLSPEAMEMIMTYIGEEEYKKQAWEKYEKAFQSKL